MEDNPSVRDEWLKLEALDESNEFPEGLINASEYENDDFKNHINNMLEEALTKDAQTRKVKHRRWSGMAVAAAAIVMLFTLTEGGRGLARSAYEAIVTLLGGEVQVEMTMPESEYPKNTDFQSESFFSLGDAASFLDYPLIGIENEHVIVNYINVHNLDSFITIETEYATAEKAFVIIQSVYKNKTDLNSNMDVSGGDAFEYKVLDGQTLYCLYTTDNNSMGIALWDNVDLNIMSENMMWNELIQYIDKLNYHK